MQLYKPSDYASYVGAQVQRHTSLEHEYPLSPWHEDVFNEFGPYLTDPVIDLGTRNGLLLEELGKRGHPLAFGIELTDLAKFAQQEKRRNVIQADIQKHIPFPDKFFKSAVITHTLEHLYDPVAGLKEIARILDGHILVIAPLFGGDAKRLEQYGHYVFFETIDDIVRILSENGFSVLQTYDKGIHCQGVIAKTI